MKKIALGVALLLAPVMASAQLSVQSYDPSRVVFRDSATIEGIIISSGAFALAEKHQLSGASFVSLQSTDAIAGFCCAFTANATTTGNASDVAQACMSATLSADSSFYELAVRKWYKNLKLYCVSLKTTATGGGAALLRVIQGR